MVIPYFQRESGLLRRAIASAFAQNVSGLRVIVVDDGSPVSARSELSSLPPVDRACVTLVEQANAGPAAARNRGLDAVSTDLQHIAFLDSDDEWQPYHLPHALVAFAAGADIYFCDYKRVQATDSRFTECGFTVAGSRRLDGAEELYAYSGDLFDALLRRSPIVPSSFVYRRAVAPALRFREDLFVAEDTYFAMELARLSRMNVFSPLAEAMLGKGVNIWQSASWDTPQALRRLFSEHRMHREAARNFTLTREQLAFSTLQAEHLRRGFALSFLHLARHRKPIDWRLVFRLAASEPRLVVDVARRLVSTFVR